MSSCDSFVHIESYEQSDRNKIDESGSQPRMSPDVVQDKSPDEWAQNPSQVMVEKALQDVSQINIMEIKQGRTSSSGQGRPKVVVLESDENTNSLIRRKFSA